MPSKYASREKKEVVRPWKIHPIWRGIGCLMMILVPIISWAIAEIANIELRKFKFGSFLGELPGNVTLPDIFYKIPGLSSLSNWISSIPNLPAKLLLFLAALLVVSGIVSVLYALVYRLIGPPRYSPLDAPASKVRAKRYTR